MGVDEGSGPLLLGLTKLVILGPGVLLELLHELRHAVSVSTGELGPEEAVPEPFLGGVDDGLFAETVGLALDLHKPLDVALQHLGGPLLHRGQVPRGDRVVVIALQVLEQGVLESLPKECPSTREGGVLCRGNSGDSHHQAFGHRGLTPPPIDGMAASKVMMNNFGSVFPSYGAICGNLNPCGQATAFSPYESGDLMS